MSDKIRLVAGIDEAGRGSLIGPLVVAAVAATPEKIRTLRELGVRDSKKLSRRRREAIYEELTTLGLVIKFVKLPPSMIDRYARRMGGPGINALEAYAAAALVRRIGPDIVYVDSPTRIAGQFANLIRNRLGGVRCRLICEHGADASRLIVSAASIVAKVVRDRTVERLKNMLGDFGSGYPSDKRTIRKAKELLRADKYVSSYMRMSWRTLDHLQPSLDDYWE
jgi:ribonuclease HII